MQQVCDTLMKQVLITSSTIFDSQNFAAPKIFTFICWLCHFTIGLLSKFLSFVLVKCHEPVLLLLVGLN